MSATPDSVSVESPKRRGTSRIYTFYVVAALLSSAGGSLVIQRFAGLIQPTQKMTDLYSITQLSPTEADELRILERTRSCKNMSLVLGLTGLLFASCLGISEGLVEKSFPACIFGLVAGAGLGSLGGAGGGCLSVYVDDWVQHRVANDLIRNMLTHTSSWIVISAAAALAILIATRRARFVQCLQFVITAMSAAMICGAIYGLVSAILFPEVETGQPLPQGDANQILWLLATTLMVSMAAARSRPRPAD